MRTLIVLFIVFSACCASAYMTMHTIKQRDNMMWQAERFRERAMFSEVKYKVLVQKYQEQEKLLNTCRGN